MHCYSKNSLCSNGLYHKEILCSIGFAIKRFYSSSLTTRKTSTTLCFRKCCKSYQNVEMPDVQAKIMVVRLLAAYHHKKDKVHVHNLKHKIKHCSFDAADSFKDSHGTLQFSSVLKLLIGEKCVQFWLHQKALLERTAITTADQAQFVGSKEWSIRPAFFLPVLWEAIQSIDLFHLFSSSTYQFHLARAYCTRASMITGLWMYEGNKKIIWKFPSHTLSDDWVNEVVVWAENNVCCHG